jgi:hypothetical protein
LAEHLLGELLARGAAAAATEISSTMGAYVHQDNLLEGALRALFSIFGLGACPSFIRCLLVSCERFIPWPSLSGSSIKHTDEPRLIVVRIPSDNGIAIHNTSGRPSAVKGCWMPPRRLVLDDDGGILVPSLTLFHQFEDTREI